MTRRLRVAGGGVGGWGWGLDEAVRTVMDSEEIDRQTGFFFFIKPSILVYLQAVISVGLLWLLGSLDQNLQ